MNTVRIVAIGNSLGILLPKEWLAQLRVGKGDCLYLVETPTGVELTPYDPAFVAQMEVMESAARSERNVLSALGSIDE